MGEKKVQRGAHEAISALRRDLRDLNNLVVPPDRHLTGCPFVSREILERGIRELSGYDARPLPDEARQRFLDGELVQAVELVHDHDCAESHLLRSQAARYLGEFADRARSLRLAVAAARGLPRDRAIAASLRATLGTLQLALDCGLNEDADLPIAPERALSSLDLRVLRHRAALVSHLQAGRWDAARAESQGDGDALVTAIALSNLGAPVKTALENAVAHAGSLHPRLERGRSFAVVATYLALCGYPRRSAVVWRQFLLTDLPSRTREGIEEICRGIRARSAGRGTLAACS